MGKKKKTENEVIEQKEEWTVPEIEGDKYGWFYVCGECHSQIIWKQEKCLHCKRRLNWNE